MSISRIMQEMKALEQELRRDTMEYVNAKIRCALRIALTPPQFAVGDIVPSGYGDETFEVAQIKFSPSDRCTLEWYYFGQGASGTTIYEIAESSIEAALVKQAVDKL